MAEVVGKGLTVTVPNADADEQLVVVLLITTLYVPATVVVNVATSPGLVAPSGMVHS
jgi:hypothetical protein